MPVGELVTIAQRLRTIAHITLGTDAIYMSQTLSTRHAIDTQKKKADFTPSTARARAFDDVRTMARENDTEKKLISTFR